MIAVGARFSFRGVEHVLRRVNVEAETVADVAWCHVEATPVYPHGRDALACEDPDCGRCGARDLECEGDDAIALGDAIGIDLRLRASEAV